jgi:hypothetical protein
MRADSGGRAVFTLSLKGRDAMLRTRLYVLLVAMFSMTFAQQASADRSDGAATASGSREVRRE